MTDALPAAPRPAWLIGVTGTNGKTTTAALIGHLLRAADWTVATATTVGTAIGGVPHPATRLLDVLTAAAGCRAVVQETTSYALHHGLTRNHAFDAAVFTNLTHDHLDQHGGRFEHYLAAKAQLFTSLARSAHDTPIAVLNAGQPASALLSEVLAPKVRRVTWGWTTADVTGEERGGQLHANGVPVPSPLVGRHMAENVLAALALVTALGVPLPDAAAAVASFAPVPGRFERVNPGRGPAIVVDYAHSPDALQRTLEAARAVTAGQVWVVFGCGGERDREKRPVMGAIAARLADRVVITTDNPRSEDPAAIAAQIRAGAAATETIADRAGAIAFAIHAAADEDLVLIAGKGHERGQELAAGTVAFDDREAAIRAERTRR